MCITETQWPAELLLCTNWKRALHVALLVLPTGRVYAPLAQSYAFLVRKPPLAQRRVPRDCWRRHWQPEVHIDSEQRLEAGSRDGGLRGEGDHEISGKKIC